jgi:hypothetical protein
MTQDVAKQTYRGVRCLSCRQPIPLPEIVANMEARGRRQDPGIQDGERHYNRVFSLRCRVCEKEKPYRSSDIIDFEGTPTSRLSRYRSPTFEREPGRLSRAANG